MQEDEQMSNSMWFIIYFGGKKHKEAQGRSKGTGEDKKEGSVGFVSCWNQPK